MDINGHTGVVFPYISRSVQRNYDVPTGSPAGALIKTVQTDTAYDVSQGAHYGNPSAISIVTTATSGEIYSKQTINNYAPPDIANWVLDRVISTSVQTCRDRPAGDHENIRLQLLPEWPVVRGDHRAECRRQ